MCNNTMNKEEKKISMNDESFEGSLKEEIAISEHYYGDIIRKLFFAGSITILVTFPFFYNLLTYNRVLIFGGAILLILLAGLTSPKQKFVMFSNAVISFLAITFFEYYSIQFYLTDNGSFLKSLLFVVNYSLAINFLFAFYFSVKTLRGMFSK